MTYLEAVREAAPRLFGRTAAIMAGEARTSAEAGTGPPAAGRYRIIQQPHLVAPPEITVVIPTVDRPDLLQLAVRSVTGAVPAAEIVIVNDGGKPFSPEVVASLASAAETVTVAEHDANLGLAAARNSGAALARGRWLAMLDDDDTLLPGGLEALLQVERTQAGTRFLYGDHCRQFYEGDATAEFCHVPTLGERFEELLIENPIMCGTFVIERDAFWSLRGYDETLPVHEDYNLHLRALSALGSAYVPVAVAVYHCRQALPRLNHRRLHWFATSAYNHAVYRTLFGVSDDLSVRVRQRENQYAHLSRALDEGCPLAFARALSQDWWRALKSMGLAAEVSFDQQVMRRVIPALLE